MELVEEEFHRDYFLQWFNALCPVLLKRQVDLDRMKALLAKYETTDKNFFVKLLREAIDDMEDLMEMEMKNS